MYLYFKATATLYVLSVITVILFMAGVICSVILWKKGKAPSLHKKVHVGAILKAFILDVVLQLQILKISFIRWLMHFCIFIGFLGLFAQTSVMAFMSHFLPEDSAIAHTFFTVGEPGSILFDVWGDLFGAMLLLGLVIAIVRRYVVKSQQLETISRDTVSIVLLTTIAVTGFLCEGFRLMDPQYASVASYSFIGSAVASILNAAGVPQMAYTVWVWIHALISLFFLAYIPFSKAWHIFVSPVEIILDASERA